MELGIELLCEEALERPAKVRRVAMVLEGEDKDLVESCSISFEGLSSQRKQADDDIG